MVNFHYLKLITEANDRKFATDRQRLHENFQSLIRNFHPVIQAHAATAVYKENKMVIGTIG